MKIRRFPRLAPDPSFNRKLLRKVIRHVNKAYSRKSETRVLTMLGDSVFSYERPYISSGVAPIDYAVSGGRGFPMGIVEIFGPEASGKTAIIESALAEAQHLGYHTFLYPAEYSPNYKRMLRVGIKPDNLAVFDAETIEEFYDQLVKAVTDIRRHDKITPIVIGWDSIASTPSGSEMENKKGLAGSDMGKVALLLSRFFRRLRRFLFLNNVCLLCINQTRTNLAQMYGNAETTPGGKALRFYAWVRCRIRQMEQIKDKDDNVIGAMCELKVVKNKVAPPFKTIRFPIYWSRGIDRLLALWEYAKDNDVLTKKGTSYRYNGKIVTRAKWPQFYNKHKSRIDKECIHASRI